MLGAWKYLCRINLSHTGRLKLNQEPNVEMSHPVIIVWSFSQEHSCPLGVFTLLNQTFLVKPLDTLHVAIYLTFYAITTDYLLQQNHRIMIQKSLIPAATWYQRSFNISVSDTSYFPPEKSSPLQRAFITTWASEKSVHSWKARGRPEPGGPALRGHPVFDLAPGCSWAQGCSCLWPQAAELQVFPDYISLLCCLRHIRRTMWTKCD